MLLCKWHTRAAARSTRTARAPIVSRGRLRVTSLFTGIVQGTAKVAQVDKMQDFARLQVQFPMDAIKNVQVGASVAINGTCLTVTKSEGDNVFFDVMVETLRATNLGALQPGSTVNFERSARVGDEIGGHTVSGHVHCTAIIVAVQETEKNRRVTFEVSESKWMKYILPKGFISVDGCSLTVGEVSGTQFTVYLIPETIRITVFGTKKQGDAVNIEVEAQTQAIVDTVERVLAQYVSKQ